MEAEGSIEEIVKLTTESRSQIFRQRVFYINLIFFYPYYIVGLGSGSLVTSFYPPFFLSNFDFDSLFPVFSFLSPLSLVSKIRKLSDSAVTYGDTIYRM